MKQSYSIQKSLADSRFDDPITLSRPGSTFAQQLTFTIRQIVFGFLVIGFAFAQMSMSYLSYTWFWLKVCLLLLILGVGLGLLYMDANYQYTYVKYAHWCSYVSKVKRVDFHADAKALGPLALLGVKRVDKDTGMLTMNDNRVGFMYRVVGNASFMLFDDDMRRILDEVEGFYEGLDPSSMVQWLTVKQAQHIDEQLEAAKVRVNYFQNTPVSALAEYRLGLLRKFVGRQFRSITQYLLISAPSYEQLMRVRSQVIMEVSSSGAMMRRCEALKHDEVVAVLHEVFG